MNALYVKSDLLGVYTFLGIREFILKKKYINVLSVEKFFVMG